MTVLLKVFSTPQLLGSSIMLSCSSIMPSSMVAGRCSSRCAVCCPRHPGA